MNKPSLYLAGPTGILFWDKITEWRIYVKQTLGDCGIDCISPLRHKEYLVGRDLIGDSHHELIMSTATGVFTQSMFDVERTSGLFVNLLGTKQVCISTVMEIAFAWSIRHPIIVVMERDNIHQQSMLNNAVSWVVETIDDGIEIARELF